jgi:hypothetical protein
MNDGLREKFIAFLKKENQKKRLIFIHYVFLLDIISRNYHANIELG